MNSPFSRPGRKVVTVLFCDVVGYTELGERLDPESVHALLSRHFDRAAAVIEHHGAKVETSLGDQVIAVFGVPTVHEDDALRAVRAAVELRDAVTLLEPGLGPGMGLECGSGSTPVQSSPVVRAQAAGS